MSLRVVLVRHDACAFPVGATRRRLGVADSDAARGRIPRVFGLDTHEPAAWAHAIGRVLVDDGLRARLAAGARTRAGMFSWEETAERTLAIYERARASLRAPV